MDYLSIFYFLFASVLYTCTFMYVNIVASLGVYMYMCRHKATLHVRHV